MYWVLVYTRWYSAIQPNGKAWTSNLFYPTSISCVSRWPIISTCQTPVTSVRQYFYPSEWQHPAGCSLPGEGTGWWWSGSCRCSLQRENGSRLKSSQSPRLPVTLAKVTDITAAHVSFLWYLPSLQRGDYYVIEPWYYSLPPAVLSNLLQYVYPFLMNNCAFFLKEV